MSQSWKSTILLLLLAGLPGSQASAQGTPARPRPLPVSAHNCYPTNSTRNDRVAEALALGMDNIEIDLGWDEAGKRLLVGHDASPRPGVAYPEFESYLVPALEAHWKNPRSDGAPTVLTVDWKTDEPEAVARFKAFLDAHPNWFSSAPKSAESPLTVRRLTVCLSGSDTAKDRYDALVPPGGEYRAFRDKVFGAGVYLDNIADYAPTPATPYHRFLAFHWSNIERGGPPRAGEWTEAEAKRLADLMTLLHRQGFRARFYCLNGHTGPLISSYRFRTDADAQIRWHAAAKAGADWVACDEYAELVGALSPKP